MRNTLANSPVIKVVIWEVVKSRYWIFKELNIHWNRKEERDWLYSLHGGSLTCDVKEDRSKVPYSNTYLIIYAAQNSFYQMDCNTWRLEHAPGMHAH